MTCTKGNSEFCFLKTFIEVEGNKTHCSTGPVIKCFCSTCHSKNCEKIVCLMLDGIHAVVLRSATWLRSSPKLLFSRELLSFVRPGELVGFDTRHVTRSPPIYISTRESENSG